MGLNDTPSSERVHIGFFGARNAGKSSLVNAFTNQELSVVSEVLGTTTDPVTKSMELLPMGPVMIIDTPGFDDVGALGEKRVMKTKQILNKTDVAILVTDCTKPVGECESALISLFKEKNIPYITVRNKSDMLPLIPKAAPEEMYVSALDKTNIIELRERTAHLVNTSDTKMQIVGDLLEAGDVAVLVVPIDSAAPKGRLILPQQQTIRDVLEAGAAAIVVRETELSETLSKLKAKPKMVITDSQAFGKVSKDTPQDVLLTSFSILMARYKGFLETSVMGASAIEKLKDGDTVLVSEGCTHHRQCEDIGTVKIPKWLKEYTGRNLNFEFSSGTGFPEELSKYSLIVHCGGCMLNEREMKYRMKCAVDQNTPFTNYGIMIAYIHGILKRSLEVFPKLSALLEGENK